jgi:transposase
MFAISSRSRFYLYTGVTDMRKGFDGLSGIVRNQLGHSPLSGDVFVFLNRRRDRIKLLVWDRNGYWVLYKRLESGRFQRLGKEESGRALRLVYDEVVMLLEGIHLGSVTRLRRFKKVVS